MPKLNRWKLPNLWIDCKNISSTMTQLKAPSLKIKCILSQTALIDTFSMCCKWIALYQHEATQRSAPLCVLLCTALRTCPLSIKYDSMPALPSAASYILSNSSSGYNTHLFILDWIGISATNILSQSALSPIKVQPVTQQARHYLLLCCAVAFSKKANQFMYSPHKHTHSFLKPASFYKNKITYNRKDVCKVCANGGLECDSGQWASAAHMAQRQKWSHLNLDSNDSYP